MKKYLGIITIISVIIIIVLGFTVYDYIYSQRSYTLDGTNLEFKVNDNRDFVRNEERLHYISIHGNIYNMIMIIILILIISIIAFSSLLIYMIVRYKKYKEINGTQINILLTLLLTIVLFIRTIIRYEIYEIINITSITIILNIFISIVTVIIANLVLKKSIYRWIVSAIGLDILFIYLVNKVMFPKYTVNFEDFCDLKINITCTCIALFIVLIAYLIKNIINTMGEK